MSRSGYSSDGENIAMWRGMVASATRGKRGQKLFRDLLAALDAMPEKRLIVHHLEANGEVCALGACGKYRGIDMSDIDADEPVEVAGAFDIAECLAQEVVYMNDEYYDRTLTDDKKGYRDYTPEERWQKMRDWVVKQIRPVPQHSEGQKQ
jgi:hypothetical protein